MSEPERFSLATHLYVRMRRSGGRVVDAVWMSQNDEYAREILRIASAEADPEIQSLVAKFSALLNGSAPRPAVRGPAAPAPRGNAPAPEPGQAQNYVRTLR